MCFRCRAIEHYADALGKVFQITASTLATVGQRATDMPDEVKECIPLFRLMGDALASTRSAARTRAQMEAMTPDERRAAHHVAAALCMAFSDVEDVLAIARKMRGELGDDDIGAEGEPDGLADTVLDRLMRATSAQLSADGRAVLEMPSTLATPELRAEVQAIFSDMAQKLAALTGSAVEVADFTVGPDGQRVTPINRTVTAPGQFPVGRDDSTLH